MSLLPLPKNINPLKLIRDMLPPWKVEHQSLARHEMRLSRRLSNSLSAVLAVSYLVLIWWNLYLFNMRSAGFQTTQRPIVEELLPNLLIILLLGLGLLVGGSRWRLILIIAGRTARLIAERRMRGDWDVIAVTSIPRLRWLRAQMMGIGWQVFPLTRLILIANALLLIPGTLYVIYLLSRAMTYNSGIYFQPDASWLRFAVGIIPITLVMLIFPLLELPLYTAMGLLVSSYMRRVSSAIGFSLAGIYLVRWLLSLLLLGVGFLVLLLVGVLIGDDLDILQFIEVTRLPRLLFAAVLGLGLAAAVIAFFIEWMPLIPMLLLAVDMHQTIFLWIWISVLITGLITYIIMPLILSQWLIKRAAIRLNRY